MEITRTFEFMRNIWLSLVTLSKPFFEWLTTELEIIEMTPFELIFGLGIIVVIMTALIKFVNPL